MRPHLKILVPFMATALFLGGCGGGNSSSPTGPGTPSGTADVTVASRFSEVLAVVSARVTSGVGETIDARSLQHDQLTPFEATVQAVGDFDDGAGNTAAGTAACSQLSSLDAGTQAAQVSGFRVSGSFSANVSGSGSESLGIRPTGRGDGRFEVDFVSADAPVLIEISGTTTFAAGNLFVEIDLDGAGASGLLFSEEYFDTSETRTVDANFVLPAGETFTFSCQFTGAIFVDVPEGGTGSANGQASYDVTVTFHPVPAD